jgi:hypothetical protein
MRIENVRRQKLDGAQQTDRLIRAARRVFFFFIDIKSSVDRIIIAIFRCETSVKP